ncbi:MAG TPA: hypothetical protein VF158_11090 [Longimicrobiales bacterium]
MTARAAAPGAARRAPRVAGPGAGQAGRSPAWAAPAALAAVHLLLALLAFDPTPYTGGDNAAYMTLARSLLERGRFLEMWDPASPPHILYPPGFPGLLALAMLLGIDSWVGLKLVIIAASTAAVVFSYLWLVRRWGGRVALGIGILLASSPGIVGLSHSILSDVPFWMLTMAALWGFARLEAGERGGAAVAVAATVLAYFTRSAGLPLALAAGAWLALGRRRRALAALAATLLPLAFLWWLRGRGVAGADYMDSFWLVNPYRPELGRIGAADLAARMWANNGLYMRVYLPVLLFGEGGGALAFLGIGVALLALAGWALEVRRPGPGELFLPLYIGLLYVWPEVWAGDRFLLPAVPLILGYAARTLAAIVGRLRVARPAPVGAAAVGLVILLGLPAQLDAARQGMTCTAAYRLGSAYPCLPPAWQDFFSIAEWARDNLPGDAVILSRKPRLFYALSGHRGRIYPRNPDPAELVREAREAGARYVILDLLDAQSIRYLIPALTHRPAAFCIVHTLGPERVTVFGVMPGADTIPDQAGDAADARFAVCPAGYAPSR